MAAVIIAGRKRAQLEFKGQGNPDDHLIDRNSDNVGTMRRSESIKPSNLARTHSYKQFNILESASVDRRGSDADAGPGLAAQSLFQKASAFLQDAADQENAEAPRVLYSGTLKKMVASHDLDWVERKVSIMDTEITFQKIDGTDVLDNIPLLEITECVHLSGEVTTLTSALAPATTLSHAQGGQVSHPKLKHDHSQASKKNVLHHDIDEPARSPQIHNGGGSAKYLDKSQSMQSMLGSANLTWKNSSEASHSKKGEKLQRTLTVDGLDSIKHVIQIFTEVDGYNSGRVYCLSAATEHACSEWISRINNAMKEAKAREAKKLNIGAFKKLRKKVARLYDTDEAQWTVGLLILANFVTSIADAETRLAAMSWDTGRQADRAKAFESLEYAFTCLFSVELVVNFVASGPWKFLNDAWSMMDFLIVTLSIFALIFTSAPGFSLLRMIRVFRVLRMVPRFRSMRRIVNSITSSVLPMLSALAVLYLVMSIYSLIAVDIFGTKEPELYGTYTSSLFTMLQVTTLEGWADLVREEDGSVKSVTKVIFFASFIIIVCWVLLNIVVAVLLDEFVESTLRDKNEEIERKMAEESKHKRSLDGPLDPLLSMLSCFTSSADLSQRYTRLWAVLDSDEIGSLGIEDLIYGLRQLELDPPLHISIDDLESMIKQCDEEPTNAAGRFEFSGFEALMNEQLRNYVQRHTSSAMQGAVLAGSSIGHVLFILKQISATLEDVNARSKTELKAIDGIATGTTTSGTKHEVVEHEKDFNPTTVTRCASSSSIPARQDKRHVVSVPLAQVRMNSANEDDRKLKSLPLPTMPENTTVEKKIDMLLDMQEKSLRMQAEHTREAMSKVNKVLEMVVAISNACKTDSNGNALAIWPPEVTRTSERVIEDIELAPESVNCIVDA